MNEKVKKEEPKAEVDPEEAKKEEPKAEVGPEEKAPLADHLSGDQPDERWKSTDHPQSRQEIWRQCWMKETAQKGTAEEQTEVGRSGGWREEPIVQEAHRIKCSPKKCQLRGQTAGSRQACQRCWNQ